jgi:diguanylate cyclase (GGDEF)-like protein
MAQDIYIIDDNDELKKIIFNLFRDEKDYKIKLKKVNTNNIDDALKNIPSLIIINEDGIEENIIEVCKRIRQNEDNSITPIIVISSKKDKDHRVEVLKECVEHYIKYPIDEEYLYYTIKNIIRLLDTNRRVSPLTGLPGNVQIQAEMKKRLLNKEEFVMLYFDLDNFKAYNDVYGFLNGDEIIKFTAKLITGNIEKYATSGNTFVGHIGGDDFVAIVSIEDDYEKICQNIIAEFDKGVTKFFNQADLEKGYLEVPNRKCIIEEFPLTSLSIGVVVAHKNRFTNVLEIGEIGAQVKHLAKTTMGSAYAIDRRKNDKIVCNVNIKS